MSALCEQERSQMLNDKCCAQIHLYIDSSLKENKSAISFAEFVRANQEFIKENTREGADYKDFWHGLFGRIIQERGLQVQRGTKVNWSFFDANAGPSSTGSHQVSASVAMKNIKTRSTRQSSKSDSLPLTPEAKKQFERDFIAMEDDKKWFLRHDNEGNKVFLEDIMFKHGNDSPYEHPVHSFIMDVTDPFWESKLEDEDYEAITSVNDPTLPALSASILKIFDVCAESVEDLENSSPTTATEFAETNKAIIKKLWKAVTSFGFFDPDEYPDEDWLQHTILDYLSMYRHRTLDEIIRNGSEMDFVLRCWRNLDRCFEDFATVGRDRTCLSTFVRVNNQRLISGMGPIDAQKPSVRPDLLVMKDGLDLAVGECGKEDLGGVGKKELVERKLHVPKVLKDVLTRAVEKGGNQASLARTMKAVAINENSTRMQVTVMDCPRGYVCRLVNSEEYEIPLTADMITAQLFPILKLTLKVKLIIKNTVTQIKDNLRARSRREPGILSVKRKATEVYLPSALTTANKKPKKNEKVEVEETE